MLTKVSQKKIRKSHGAFAIVASRYNAVYVDAMLEAAEAVLNEAGVRKLRVVRVPGAFEIPAVAARLADDYYSAIICLGVIIRGQTDHAQQIGNGVSYALAKIQVDYALPVIHEVLLLESEAQAKVRCLDKEHNRGAEAAHTALEMAEVMESLH